MIPHPPSAFGALLRLLRNSAGLTQLELAERCRLRRESIGILERDERVPRRATVAALAAALGLEGTARARFASTARPDEARAQLVAADATVRTTDRGGGDQRAAG